MNKNHLALKTVRTGYDLDRLSLYFPCLVISIFPHTQCYLQRLVPISRRTLWFIKQPGVIHVSKFLSNFCNSCSRIANTLDLYDLPTQSCSSQMLSSAVHQWNIKLFTFAVPTKSSLCAEWTIEHPIYQPISAACSLRGFTCCNHRHLPEHQCPVLSFAEQCKEPSHLALLWSLWPPFNSPWEMGATSYIRGKLTKSLLFWKCPQHVSEKE